MNISIFDHCYGCGVCSAICPTKIIDIKENIEGFYSPVITDNDKCINCGLCLKVCAYNDKKQPQIPSDIEAFAAWSNTPDTRLSCSSGGIAFELCNLLIDKGYNICTARYDINKSRVEHYIAKSVVDLLPSKGSKYIPSFTQKAFAEIDKNDKYVVIGSPCQIDSFRRLIKQWRKEDNFVLIDFFCHGVPSLHLWDQYLKEVRDKVGDISFVKWRNKISSFYRNPSINESQPKWSDSYNMNIKGEKGLYQSRRSEGDLFYKFFLGNYCLNSCCYDSCKYKFCASSADIRVGDLWGKKYKDNKEGVSAVFCFTDKGKKLIHDNDFNCQIIPETCDIAGEGQMKRMPTKPFIRRAVIKSLQENKPLPQIIKSLIKPYDLLIGLPKRIFNKSMRICRIKYQLH